MSYQKNCWTKITDIIFRNQGIFQAESISGMPLVRLHLKWSEFLTPWHLLDCKWSAVISMLVPIVWIWVGLILELKFTDNLWYPHEDSLCIPLVFLSYSFVRVVICSLPCSQDGLCYTLWPVSIATHLWKLCQHDYVKSGWNKQYRLLVWLLRCVYQKPFYWFHYCIFQRDDIVEFHWLWRTDVQEPVREGWNNQYRQGADLAHLQILNDSSSPEFPQ